MALSVLSLVDNRSLDTTHYPLFNPLKSSLVLQLMTLLMSPEVVILASILSATRRNVKGADYKVF